MFWLCVASSGPHIAVSHPMSQDCTETKYMCKASSAGIGLPFLEMDRCQGIFHFSQTIVTSDCACIAGLFDFHASA